MIEPRVLADPIGILGGTFDPIHNGHLEIAVDAAKQLGIADMRLMPNPMPPHREEPLLAPDDRIQALNLALGGYPSLSLELSEWNAVTQGETNSGYTVESMRRLRAVYPDRPVVFVLGDDAYEHIASWKEYTELPALCHVVVVSRPGYQQAIDGVAAEWLDRYKPTPDLSIEASLAGSVQHLLVTAVDVSATQIRRILGAGKLPEGLLPEAVLRFLESKLCHPTPAQN